jgi:hypothetical protein
MGGDDRVRGGTLDAGTLRGARRARPGEAELEASLLSGEAWHRYCDALRAAGDHLIAANPDASPETRAEGIRYLLGLVRGGLGQALELADPLRPRFFRNPDSMSRWGAENADNQYLWARVDPRMRYRIRGVRGTAFDFLIEVKEGYMQLGDERNFATLGAAEIACDTDGRFELGVSGRRGPGDASRNWLALDPAARYVAIRQYLCDGSEVPARFEIECLDEVGPERVDPARIASSLLDAGEWTEGSARFWTAWTDALRGAWVADELPRARRFVGGADAIFYGNAFYRLGPDEALVIECDRPEARYWQFQLCDLWFRSADWVERQTSLNHHQARLDADGRFRCVVAHADPGIANWLDTGGAGEGVLQYRFVWSTTNPQPSVRTLPFARLEEALPEGTARTSPEEREERRRARRRHRALREPAS